MDRDEFLKTSKVFCMAPWVRVLTTTSGEVLPCCPSGGSFPSAGSTRSGELKEIWNSAYFRRLRLNMLAGERSRQCGLCYEQEESRVPSLRRADNERFAGDFDSVEATREDGSLPRFAPRTVILEFSNRCNFRCHICEAATSSAWIGEARRLAGVRGFPKNYVPSGILTPTREPEAFWRQIEAILPSLEEIHFLGGEPLLAREHYRALRALLDRRLFHIRLFYNTNFSIMNFQGNDVMKMWDRFESVRVSASLDGSGRRGEYMRKGQVWKQAVANRRRMIQVCPRVDFYVMPTISAMNVLHLPDFYDEMAEAGYVDPRKMDINFSLVKPACLRVQILPPALRRRAIEKYERHVAKMERRGGEGLQPAFGGFKGVLALLRGPRLDGRLEEFRTYIRKLDEMRGESFLDAFPEMADLMHDR
ncbi:MAG: twitch domain-containing radical SAM protein [Elusimicrobiota bacterium]